MDRALACNLDWLRYSKPWDGTQDERTNLLIALPRHPVFFLTGEMVGNGRGYDRAMAASIGIVHWHTKRPEQGVSFELGGEDLRESRAREVLDIDLLRHVAAIGGKVSTMDGALDLFNFGARPMDIIKARDAGTLQTKARHIGHHESTNRIAGAWVAGETVYVGSPKSDSQIKVYDKAAEQGVKGDWIRLECRWRDVKAHMAHKAMLEQGIPPVVRAALADTLTVPEQWWSDMLSEGVGDIDPVGRKTHDTRAWLLKAALPALVKELEAEFEEGESALLNAFSLAILPYLKDTKS